MAGGIFMFKLRYRKERREHGFKRHNRNDAE